MKKYTSVILFMLISTSINAQDKIYFNDDSTLETKISAVSETDIQYKRFDNLSGPTFTIGLENINMIVFENGTHQIINVRPKKVVSSRNNSSGQRRNRFNGDLLAIGSSGPTSISYERLNSDGSRGVETALNVYFNSDVGVIGSTIGANVKYYVGSGGGGKGFYIGPSFSVGVFSFEQPDDDGYSDSFSVWAGVKLGQQFQLSDLFGINLAGNLGTYSDFDVLIVGYSINLGVNFTF